MPGSQSVVSIVIPMHNAARYVGHALASALGQTHDSIEVIAVDDGSTDDTAEIVRAVRDARVHYVYQQNQGQSTAINLGVRESTGDFIKLLDADDWINPVHIAAQLDAIKDADGAVASCHWGYFVNDFIKPVVFDEYTNRNYDDPLEWLIDSLQEDEGMMGGWMWLIPRKVWERAGGYDPRLSLNNDFHFSIALLLASEGVRFAEDAVYSYRRAASGSLSGSQGRKAMESALLTTELGTTLLLQREDSPRVRKICADRFQHWLFRFYPVFPDLVGRAERQIDELGGSDETMQGGRLLRILQPLIGWKAVRQLQSLVYRFGWAAVLRRKTRRRLSRFQ